MKNIKYKVTTFFILIIVVIPLLDSTALMGLGAPNIGWDIIHQGFFGQNVTADFSARENGVLLTLIFLISIAFIYILFRIYKFIFKKKLTSKSTQTKNP